MRNRLATSILLGTALMTSPVQADDCANAKAWVQSHQVLELDGGSKSVHATVNGDHWKEMTQPARGMVAKQIARCFAGGGYAMIKFSGSDAFRVQWSPVFGYKEF